MSIRFFSAEATTDGTSNPRLEHSATQESPQRLLSGPAGSLSHPRGSSSTCMEVSASSGTSIVNLHRVRGKGCGECTRNSSMASDSLSAQYNTATPLLFHRPPWRRAPSQESPSGKRKLTKRYTFKQASRAQLRPTRRELAHPPQPWLTGSKESRLPELRWDLSATEPRNLHLRRR